MSDVLEKWDSRMFPSLYTSALIEGIGLVDLPSGAVCEIGVGSGVCLLHLAQIGYDKLYGSDINIENLTATRELFKVYSPNVALELLQGDLWQAFEQHQRFAVVIANLPHFPGVAPNLDRPIGWQGGQGRDLMDRFLRGLTRHLNRDGVALITHHDLVGLKHTEQLLDEIGLQAEAIKRWTVFESPARMASVNPLSLIDACPTINHIGPYCFVESRVLKLTHKVFSQAA
uniref:methyltransferase domain-containing protein n=1 Tax=Orrella sp. TaxID=1921583 RepID=UPI004047AF63